MKICGQHGHGASLLTIRSPKEQEYFSNFLFNTNGVVDNVWLGGKRISSNSNEFKWNDNSSFNYANWEEGSPTKNEYGRDCIQMKSEYSFFSQNSRSLKNVPVSVGKWVDVPCKKKNLVVCQKLQYWSLDRLQKTLLDARKELQDSLENVKTQLKNHESTNNQQQSMINHLNQNPIPINFIYIQLPGQPTPKSLWPTVQWKDVTSEYSGLFFRAEGGNSTAFGAIQEENAPRLTNVKYCTSNCGTETSNVALYPNSWSYSLWAGASNQKGLYHKYLTSGGEVRPRNMAIRIWKRTA